MPGELVRRLIVEVRAAHPDLLVTCEVMDRWYTDRSDQTYTTQTGRLFKPDIVAPIEEFCTQPITKLMFLGPPQLIDATEPLLDGACRVSKAVALQKVAAAYAIPMRQVMAIGDAPNDVAMLQSAGIAIAMDNAHARCKEVAHWVAPSNNDHGVRAALLRYGLGIATPQ
jgi:hypothetical protein